MRSSIPHSVIPDRSGFCRLSSYPWWAFGQAFQPAPREYAGNMCGVRVPGLPPVDGGAADPSLVLSWFYDRYSSDDQFRIREAWGDKYPDVLLSWPDSRGYGVSAQEFGNTCQKLVGYGFRPCVMLSSKDYDPRDDFAGIIANIAPVIPYLVNIVPRVCIGWELSLWMSPETCQRLIDALAPTFNAYGARVYVHFQSGYFAYQPNGQTTSYFWWQNVGKLTGILRQRDPNEDQGNQTEYQYRVEDCLVRFAGGFGFPRDSGFGHPFDDIELEITAMQQFNGEMSESDGNGWGQAAIQTPAQNGVHVMGSGNGY